VERIMINIIAVFGPKDFVRSVQIFLDWASWEARHPSLNLQWKNIKARSRKKQRKRKRNRSTRTPRNSNEQL